MVKKSLNQEVSMDLEYMTPEQQGYFRQKLEKMRSDIVKDCMEVEKNIQQETRFADLNDRASSVQQLDYELSVQHRDSRFIAEIDEALRLLKQGDYGYCSECGLPIGIARLEARPTATLCIDCKTLWEIKAKKQGNHVDNIYTESETQ